MTSADVILADGRSVRDEHVQSITELWVDLLLISFLIYSAVEARFVFKSNPTTIATQISMPLSDSGSLIFVGVGDMACFIDLDYS